MVAITTRATAATGATVKGLPLSNAELDANFINLNNFLLTNSWKEDVLVRAVSNITLSGLQTIDGVTVVAGDRVHVVGQTTAAQNGIYNASSGAWTRSLDADTALKVAGATVTALSGTAQGGLTFTTRFKSTDTLNTTSMAWYQVFDANNVGSTIQAYNAGLQSLSSISAAANSGVVTKTAANTYAIDTSTYAKSGVSQTVSFGTTSTGALTATNLTINTGLIYADTNSTVVRTGATGSEKYWRFDADGAFYALSGGGSFAGQVTSSGGFIAHSTPGGVYFRMKDNSTATGKAVLHYKDTTNYYMLLTADGDANGTFNNLRPFMINLASGYVTMYNGASISGGLTTDGLSVNGNMSLSGTSSLNGNVTVGGSWIEVGAAPGGSGSSGTSSLLRRGSLELRDTNGPYIDLSRDGTTDWHARIQARTDGNLYIDSQSAVILGGGNGGLVYANGGSGKQAGEVLTTNGTQQIVVKNMSFSASGGFTSGSFVANMEVTGPGGTAAGSEALMKFHRPGVFGGLLGLGTDNQLRVGGWSYGDVSYRLWTEQNFDPATKVNTSSLSTSYGASSVAQRDSGGGLYGSFLGTAATSGNGLRLWNGDAAYSIYMSDEANSTWGGRPSNSSVSDYNMYFRMTDGNRGFVFKYGSTAVAKINNAGDFVGARVGSNEWFYNYGAGGLYNDTYGQGIRSSGSAGHSYGTMAPHGSGANGWTGFSLSTDNRLCLMSNTDTVGLHHTSNSWLFSSNMAGDFTFRGNVTAYSDLRLKKDVRPIDNLEARFENLAAGAIMYERDGRTRVGYGAQTIREVNPEFVHEADDAMKIATGTGTLSVDYGETAAVLAAMLKQTRDELAELRALVRELKGNDDA